ncbi:MAG: hypothetical protein ACLTXH_06755 [Enterobacter hormaechei]
MSEIIMKDPAVESLTATWAWTAPTRRSTARACKLTLNRSMTATIASTVRASQSAVARVPGIELYLQPIQDLTIDTQVSRTQYQFTLRPPRLRHSAPGSRIRWTS